MKELDGDMKLETKPVAYSDNLSRLIDDCDIPYIRNFSNATSGPRRGIPDSPKIAQLSGIVNPKSTKSKKEKPPPTPKDKVIMRLLEV